MEREFVNQLDQHIICKKHIVKEEQSILHIVSNKSAVKCPFCGQSATKVHSRYQREIRDIPMQGRQTILLLEIRKMFCENAECRHKTFAESFDFVEEKGKKTKRLMEKILIGAEHLGVTRAVMELEAEGVKVSKSTVYEMRKKYKAFD